MNSNEMIIIIAIVGMVIMWFLTPTLVDLFRLSKGSVHLLRIFFICVFVVSILYSLLQAAGFNTTTLNILTIAIGIIISLSMIYYLRKNTFKHKNKI